MEIQNLIPTVRNVDHFAFTVPNLDEAAKFFVEAFGAAELYRVREARQPGDNWMSEHLGVESQAIADIAMLNLGPVTNIELFQYSAVHRSRPPVRIQDVGGNHLAFLVEDVDAAVEYFLGRSDVRVLGSPQTMTSEFPNAGDHWVYLVTSWGFHFEVHSVPTAMPYQQQTNARRYGPAAHWTDGTGKETKPVVPTATNIDHLGITVPNLDEAISFFVQHLGAEHLYTLGPFPLDKEFAATQLDVHAAGALRQALLRLGPTDNIELFEYNVDDQLTAPPRNSDIGAAHIAFYVDDVDEASAYLERIPGVDLLGAPETIESGPIVGDRWVYFTTPIGLTMEVLNMPDGQLPYEQLTTARRAPASASWSTSAPLK
jgi:catechol 2,3-dioxygenase-like lactoylglutathione lyase family enzyme